MSLAHWAIGVNNYFRTLGDLFSSVETGQNKAMQRRVGKAGPEIMPHLRRLWPLR
jgi:hypothetical protein